MKPIISQFVLVFDVESVGLHGEAYAVAGVVTEVGGSSVNSHPFCFSCPPEAASGTDADRKWIAENVPPIRVTHQTPKEVRDAFWKLWRGLKAGTTDLAMAAECGVPVESNFLSACIADDFEFRAWEGPYPLHEIASFMAAAGMDPIASYPYEEGETKHDPLSDARQSARLLNMALAQLSSK